MTDRDPSRELPVSPRRAAGARSGASYWMKVVRAVFSLAWFALVYLVLVALAFWFASLMGRAGLYLLGKQPSYFTFALALGLMWTALMFIYFLVKFLFMKRKPDVDVIEVTASDQPELFRFVHEVADQADAPYPRHIVLGPEFNAATYFNPNFWSLFLPVRKSLRIGLGLVNTLSVGELKAVLAHEFGHFSHSSRLGSYAYTANRVIYSILFENTSFAEDIRDWASMHWVLKIFSHLTIGGVRGIQGIVRGVYPMVHKSMMALSREFEFQADAVGARVGGSEQCISFLVRGELGNNCLNWLGSTYGTWSGENLRPENAFAQHRALMLRAARSRGSSLDGDASQAGKGPASPPPSPRLHIADQWASHPSNKDRIQRLKELNVVVEPVSAPAWTLFRDPEAIQQKMTEIMFPNREGGRQTLLSTEAFIERLDSRERSFELPGIFKEYYDQHWPEPLDPEAPADASSEGASRSFDEIFSPEAIRRPAQLALLKNDMANLQAVVDNRLKVRYFEFDGVQYEAADASGLIVQLKDEEQKLRNEIEATDRELFFFFKRRACERGKGEEFLTEARSYYRSLRQYRDICRSMQETVTCGQQLSDALLWKQEELQREIRLLSLDSLQHVVNSDTRAILEEYLKEPPIALSKVEKPPSVEEPAEQEEKFMCPRCRAYLVVGVAVCPECGESIEWDDDIVREHIEKEKKSAQVNHEHEEDEEFVCPRCGAELRKGVAECPACGEKIDWAEETIPGPDEDSQPGPKEENTEQPEESAQYECPQCGTDLSPSMSYCPRCMESLDWGQKDGKAESLVVVEELADSLEEEFSVCPDCNKKVRVGQSECPVCGRALEWEMKPPKGEEPDYYCTNCNRVVPQGRLRCPYCGKTRIDMETLERVVLGILEVNRMSFALAHKRFCDYEAGLIAATLR